MDWSKPLSTFGCVVAAATDPMPYVAAFLVGRGPSAVFQLAVQPLQSVPDFGAMFPPVGGELVGRDERFGRRWKW